LLSAEPVRLRMIPSPQTIFPLLRAAVAKGLGKAFLPETPR
jgi:hypothetical protein